MSDALLAANANAATSILVDEVGIETGVFGEHRLKTTYRPVFRRRDGLHVEPFAVEGSIRPFLSGRAIEEAEFEAVLTRADRAAINDLTRVLSLNNLHNLGVEGLSLLLQINLAAIERQDALVAAAEKAGVDCAKVVCVIDTASLLDRHDLVEHTLSLRAAGFGIAVSGFGMGPWDTACTQAVRPDIVSVDATWFRRVASHPAAAKLMISLVAGLHDQGIDVMVAGIDTPAELRVAFDCGADLLAGDVLAPAALAGSDADFSRRNIAPLIGDERKVIPLFA